MNYTTVSAIKSATLFPEISSADDTLLEKYGIWAEDLIDTIVSDVAPHAENTTGKIFPRICDTDGIIPKKIVKATQKLTEILFIKNFKTAVDLQGGGGIKSENVSADGYSYTKEKLELPTTDLYLTPEIKALLDPFILNQKSLISC